MFKEIKLSNALDNLRNKLEKLKEGYNISKSSLIYSLSALFIFFGIGFFLNSNSILSNNSDLVSTPLFKKQNIGMATIDLRSRKYNPMTHTVEFMFCVESQNNIVGEIENMKIDFDIREKSNPTSKMKINKRQLDSKNYVVIAKVPKKWTVLSVAAGDTFNLKGKDTDLFQNSATRFYSNINNITKDYKLKEKTTNEYLSDASENEIKLVDREIKGIHKKIEKSKQEILKTKETIDTIEENKKYQIETELEISNNEIGALKLSIEKINDEIKNYEKDISKKNDKKEKLKLKKEDYLKK